MATVHVKTGATGIEFGIDNDEGTLITHKVQVSRKTKKKDLRGRKGGFKAVADYNKSIDVSIEGALIGAGTTGFILAAAYTLLNDDFGISALPIFVQSMTFTEKNEDYKRCSVKLIANENMASIA